MLNIFTGVTIPVGVDQDFGSDLHEKPDIDLAVKNTDQEPI